MPPSGRSIPPTWQHRRQPTRRWPLATLDRPSLRAHQPAHHAAAHRSPDLGERYRRAPHPHRYKLALALARPVCPRQCPAAGAAPQSRRTPAASQDPSTSHNRSAARPPGVPPPTPPPQPVASPSASRPSCTSASRARYTARRALTTEERASLSAYESNTTNPWFFRPAGFEASGAFDLPESNPGSGQIHESVSRASGRTYESALRASTPTE